MSSYEKLALPLVQNGHRFSASQTISVTMVGADAPPLFLDSPRECSFCAQPPRFSIFDGCVVAEGPCSAPAGITSTVTVELPSGRALVTDDLRPVFELDRALENSLASYNTALGQAQYVEEMAKLGVAYGPVLNTCPSLYRTGPTSLVIANPDYDLGADVDAAGLEPLLPGELLADVVTDLWAYSIVDYERWIAAGGRPEDLNWCDTVVDLTPGTYQFTHHTGEADFDHDAPGLVVFAHIEQVL